MAARPFDSVANYARFLKMQHDFHRDVSPLYAHPDLGRLLPDLADLSRYEAVSSDVSDLGLAPETSDTAPATAGLGKAEALGWLYVVEGSNLGAAFLFKAAKRIGLSETHGARHLAEAPEGRAQHWRRFREALNAADLSAEEEAQAIRGAQAAFERVRVLIAQHMS